MCIHDTGCFLQLNMKNKTVCAHRRIGWVENEYFTNWPSFSHRLSSSPRRENILILAVKKYPNEFGRMTLRFFIMIAVHLNYETICKTFELPMFVYTSYMIYERQ